ncbi:hypothetical protein JW979_13500, partial [bacterium]|nr:hypothetical protein [candidate division CSSED10-310 bacterium]
MLDKTVNSRILLYFLLVCYVFISIVYVFAGTLHLDEGAYLYAARSVYKGAIPYKDFFFLQPPVYPYIYGISQWMLPGLISGRITSVIFSTACLLLLLHWHRRQQNPSAALITLALLTSNTFQLYFFTITRLYALAGFFLVLGCIILTRNPYPNLRDGILSMLFFAFMVGTRITLLP